MRRLRTAAAVLLAVTLALAGCAASVDGTGTRAEGSASGGSTSGGSTAAGSDGATPSGGDRITDPVELLAAMEKDTLAAIEGDGVVLFVDARRSDLVTHLQLTLHGDDADGTLKVGGEECELVRVGAATYAKASAKFWTLWAELPAATAASIDGTWVQATHQAGDLSTATDGAGWVDRLGSMTDPYAGDLTERESREAIEVHNDAGYQLLVFTESPHTVTEGFSPNTQYGFALLDDPAAAVTAPAGSVPFPA